MDELTNEIVKNWKMDYSMKEFNKIIQEREAEHRRNAREKRELDLVRIQQNMQSSTGLDPLQLFPREIWMMFLQKLLPHDRRNFRESHEVFQTLTESILVRNILLPMMLTFKPERMWGQPDPVLSPGELVPPSQYKKLRLVSKSLRNAVDRWYEDYLVNEMNAGHEGDRPARVVRINLRSLNDFQKIGRMKAHLTSPSCSNYLRFFTRSLCIVSPRRRGEAEPLVEFAANIDKILDHVGDQIWYFSFEFKHPSDDVGRNVPALPEQYASFLGWLSRMPNLKWLKFSVDQSEDETTRFSLPAVSPPELLHLERLDLELKSQNRYLMPAYHQLISAYPYVKILSLLGLKSILGRENGFFASASVKPAIALALRVLVLNGPIRYPPVDHSEEDDEDRNQVSDFTLLQSITNSKWPLRKIDCEMKMGTVYVDTIFNALGNLPTLEELRLLLDDNVKIRDRKVFLNLPELTHFQFRMRKSSNDGDRECKWGSVFSLQFLILAKKLKYLNWNCSMDRGDWKKVQQEALEMNEVKLGEILDFDWIQLKSLRLAEYGAADEFKIWRVFRSLEAVILNLAIQDRPLAPAVSSKYFRDNSKFGINRRKPKREAVVG